MKYIVFTYDGHGLPIANRLHQEGCEVTVAFIEDIKDYVLDEEVEEAVEDKEFKKRRLSLYKNMLNIQPAQKVVEWMKKIEKPYEYFVFFDLNNLYRWADKVRDLGFEGNFPTKEDMMLEIDRDAAKQFVKKHYSKLNTPEVKDFKKVQEALEFIKKTDEMWVIKSKGESPKTYVPEVDDIDLFKEQLVEMLNNHVKEYEERGFILEKRIAIPLELTPQKIYYDGVPLGTIIDLENKPFGSGNISVQTGCSESLVFPTEMDEKINKIAFPPIVDEMARKHKGLFIWDASILIDKKDGKMYFGEFCSNRPGYNTIFAEIAQAQSANDYFENIAHKKSPYTIGTVGTTVRVFNLNRDPQTEKVSQNIAVNYKPEIEKDLWMWDVKKNERGHLLNCGLDWNLAVITGANKSVDDAVAKMYKNVEGFSFVGAYYRSKDDFLSLDYPTSIPNRLNYGLDHGLYTLPFNVKLGAIKGVK